MPFFLLCFCSNETNQSLWKTYVHNQNLNQTRNVSFLKNKRNVFTQRWSVQVRACGLYEMMGSQIASKVTPPRSWSEKQFENEPADGKKQTIEKQTKKYEALFNPKKKAFLLFSFTSLEKKLHLTSLTSSHQKTSVQSTLLSTQYSNCRYTSQKNHCAETEK